MSTPRQRIAVPPTPIIERKRTMPTMRACLAVLLAAALTPALAQDRTFYDVEIVLFENLDVRAAENERWRPRVVVPEFDRVAAFEPGQPRPAGIVEPPRGFEQLPLEQSRLGDAVERLEKSARYRVVRHLLWRQPGLEAVDSVPLRVQAGEPVSVRVPEPSRATVALAPPEAPVDDEAADGESGDEGERSAGATAPDAASTTPRADGDRNASGGRYRPYPGVVLPPMHDVEIRPLDGTVRIVVSRYIHIHADLYFTTAVEWTGDDAALPGSEPGGTATPADPSAGEATPVPRVQAPRIARGPDGQAMLTYPFVQQRRMRSGELHYLDNPVLGLLVLVTPLQEEESGGG